MKLRKNVQASHTNNSKLQMRGIKGHLKKSTSMQKISRAINMVIFCNLPKDSAQYQSKSPHSLKK